MQRRDFLKTTALASGAGLSQCLTAGQAPAVQRRNGDSPPNVLLIITDQQVVDSISAYRDVFTHPAYGVHHVSTPNLDRLVTRGTSFINNYSTNPVCSPCRSSIFTGRQTIETGVTVNDRGIDATIPNLGEWLESNTSYNRYYCGKWHIPAGYPGISGSTKTSGFEVLPVGGGGTGDFVDYQVSGCMDALIRTYSEPGPFMAVASLMNPHDIAYVISPWTCSFHDRTIPQTDEYGLGDALPPLPPNYHYDFPEAVRTGIGPYSTEVQWQNYIYEYLRMVEKVDHDIGRMLDAVDSRSDDTLIIFTADHGEGLGRHRRVSKWHAYEHSMRVPMIVSCPGRVSEGQLDEEHLTSSVDIVSTVCDFAGIATPDNVRGRSLRPLLEGTIHDQWHDHAYVELYQTTRVIRTDRYKYVKTYSRSGDTERPFVLRSDGSASQFVQGRGDLFEEEAVHLLFDLENDPWETNNLYADSNYASVMTEHEGLLREREAELTVGVHTYEN